MGQTDGRIALFQYAPPRRVVGQNKYIAVADELSRRAASRASCVRNR